MPLTPWACANCGFWQKHFEPRSCPVCDDTRNDLPHDGWKFLREEEVASMLTGSWRRLDRDMVAFNTSSGVIRNIFSMWIWLVDMKTWMRNRSAALSASAALSMSSGCVRASEAITGPCTAWAIRETASR